MAKWLLRGETGLVVLPHDTKSVTIKVNRCSSYVRILASFSNGNVTDSSWKCADSNYCNMSSNDCAMNKWEKAHVIENNRDDPKKYWHPEIGWKAQWIGISPYSELWCRKTFGKLKLTILKCSVNHCCHCTSFVFRKKDQVLCVFQKSIDVPVLLILRACLCRISIIVCMRAEFCLPCRFSCFMFT